MILIRIGGLIMPRIGLRSVFQSSDHQLISGTDAYQVSTALYSDIHNVDRPHQRIDGNQDSPSVPTP